jgi:hypothetical protein
LNSQSGAIGKRTQWGEFFAKRIIDLYIVPFSGL